MSDDIKLLSLSLPFHDPATSSEGEPNALSEILRDSRNGLAVRSQREACRDQPLLKDFSLRPSVNLNVFAAHNIEGHLQSADDYRRFGALPAARRETQSVIGRYESLSDREKEGLRPQYLAARFWSKMWDRDPDGALAVLAKERLESPETAGLSALESTSDKVVNGIRLNYATQIVYAGLMQNLDTETARLAVDMPEDVSAIQRLSQNFHDSVSSGRRTLAEAISDLPPATRGILERSGMWGALGDVQRAATVRQIEDRVLSLTHEQIGNSGLVGASLLAEGLKDGVTVSRDELTEILRKLPTLQAMQANARTWRWENRHRLAMSLQAMVIAGGLAFMVGLGASAALASVSAEGSFGLGLGTSSMHSLTVSSSLPVLNHGIRLDWNTFENEFRSNMEFSALLMGPHALSAGLGPVGAAVFNRTASIVGLVGVEAQKDGLNIPTEDRLFYAMLNDSMGRVGFLSDCTVTETVGAVTDMVRATRESWEASRAWNPGGYEGVSPVNGATAPSFNETPALALGALVVAGCHADGEVRVNDVALFAWGLFTAGMAAKGILEVLRGGGPNRNLNAGSPPENKLEVSGETPEAVLHLRVTRGEDVSVPLSAVDEFNRRQDDPILSKHFWSHEVPKLILEEPRSFNKRVIADALQVVRERLETAAETGDRATDIQLMAKVRQLHPDLVSRSDIELALDRADSDLTELRERWQALTALGAAISESQMRSYVTALLRSPVNAGAIYELLTGGALTRNFRTHTPFVGNRSLQGFHEWLGKPCEDGRTISDTLRDDSIAGATKLAATLSRYFAQTDELELTMPEPLLRGGPELVSLHSFNEIAGDFTYTAPLMLDSDATAQIDPDTRRIVRVTGLKDSVGRQTIFDFFQYHPIENLLVSAGVEGVAMTGYDADPRFGHPGGFSIPIDSLNAAIAAGRLLLTVDKSGAVTIDAVTIDANDATSPSHTP